jgi:hypothetical protein
MVASRTMMKTARKISAPFIRHPLFFTLIDSGKDWYWDKSVIAMVILYQRNAMKRDYSNIFSS